MYMYMYLYCFATYYTHIYMHSVAPSVGLGQYWIFKWGRVGMYSTSLSFDAAQPCTHILAPPHPPSPPRPPPQEFVNSSTKFLCTPRSVPPSEWWWCSTLCVCACAMRYSYSLIRPSAMLCYAMLWRKVSLAVVHSFVRCVVDRNKGLHDVHGARVIRSLLAVCIPSHTIRHTITIPYKRGSPRDIYINRNIFVYISIYIYANMWISAECTAWSHRHQPK